MPSLQTLQAHLVLVWVLFLLPVTIVFLRGVALDRRAEALGLPSRYHWMIYLCWIPVLSCVVASLCLARWLLESYTREVNLSASW